MYCRSFKAWVPPSLSALWRGVRSEAWRGDRFNNRDKNFTRAKCAGDGTDAGRASRAFAPT